MSSMISRRSLLSGALSLPAAAALASSLAAPSARASAAPRRSAALAYEWSDANPPWAGGSLDDFRRGWPDGLTVVDLYTGSDCAGDLQSRVDATIERAGGRVVVRLPAGTQHITSCPLRGTSGDPLYAFGLWNPDLKGFLGAGADVTFVQLDAGSISQAQIAAMARLDPDAFEPLQLGMIRFDGTASDPVLLGGVTFAAVDQPDITKVHANLSSAGVVVPQPAPHNGVVLYPGTPAVVDCCRFSGAARAMTGAPPFEMADVTSQYGTLTYRRCEFDGRRGSWIDPARPRRCTVFMGDNETSSTLEDCWLHHSNVSRYAVNDQNRNTSGSYSLTRCKVERIGDGRNVDRALNGGASLGGGSDASCCGWESVNGTIAIEDSIIVQHNSGVPQYQSAPSCHYDLESVGGRNPAGGRMSVRNVTHRNPGYPTIGAYASFRVGASTHWAKDGFDETLTVYGTSGARLSPHVYTGTWPPSAGYLSSHGLSPQTHYIVRLSG